MNKNRIYIMHDACINIQVYTLKKLTIASMLHEIKENKNKSG